MPDQSRHVPIQVGLEKFLTITPTGSRQRVGLITNHSAIDHNLDHAIDVLGASDVIELAALFGPEHGVRGDAQAGEPVSSAVDTRTGLPSYSLYGATYRPDASMVQGLDALVYDIQDLGVRYATYASTMIEAMRAAGKFGLRFYVLDRPNPLNGSIVEGNVLEPGHESFVGAYTMPVRHGLTIGELARMVNAQQKLGVELIVLSMSGWRRNLWYDETDLPWLPPTPNLPTLNALTLYSGTCLIEGTNLSEGRGTTLPFEVIGAPWLQADALVRELRALQLPGINIRATTFVPVFSKHKGTLCAGIHCHVLDRDQLDATAFGVHLLSAIRRLHPNEFEWVVANEDGRSLFIDRLAGTDKLRQALDRDTNPREIMDRWQGEIDAFEHVRAPYLLYE